MSQKASDSHLHAEPPPRADWFLAHCRAMHVQLTHIGTHAGTQKKTRTNLVVLEGLRVRIEIRHQHDLILVGIVWQDLLLLLFVVQCQYKRGHSFLHMLNVLFCCYVSEVFYRSRSSRRRKCIPLLSRCLPRLRDFRL